MAGPRTSPFLFYKLLGHLLMPLPAGLALAILALLLLPRGADRLVACLILAGLWWLGTPALGRRLLSHIERRIEITPLKNCPRPMRWWPRAEVFRGGTYGPSTCTGWAKRRWWCSPAMSIPQTRPPSIN